MEQPSTTCSSGKPSASSAWDELFWGLVIMLALVLLLAVIGRVTLAGMVWWVHGRAGYDSGIRVHFVGKAPWFTNGEPVPGPLAAASSLAALVVSILLSYLILSCARHIHRRIRRQRHAGS